MAPPAPPKESGSKTRASGPNRLVKDAPVIEQNLSLQLQGGSVTESTFWAIAQTALDSMSRQQQLQLAKMIAGANGAVLSFPNARESALRKEMVKRTQLGPKPVQRAQAKPENIAMKGSMEEITLHRAQKALREKRLVLNLAKNDTSDPQIAAEIKAVKDANAAFQAKKQAIKDSNN